jgi:hypothetical protein
MLDTSRSKLDHPPTPQPTSENQRTKLLETLAINEDISDDSDRDDNEFTESPTSAEPENHADLSFKTNEQQSVEKRSSTPDSQNDEDIMSQLNKVLDDFGRSEYKSPPLTSPLGDGRSISSLETKSTYSQDSYNDTDAKLDVPSATRSPSQEKLGRSASTMRKAHQSMMFSDNFGLEALMTLVRGDAEYLESLERSKHGQGNNDRELTSSKYLEEVRIQVSKELFGEQLSQLDTIEKVGYSGLKVLQSARICFNNHYTDAGSSNGRCCSSFSMITLPLLPIPFLYNMRMNNLSQRKNHSIGRYRSAS